MARSGVSRSRSPWLPSSRSASMAGQALSCRACSRRLLVLLATGVRVNLRPGVGAVFVPVFVLVGLAAHHLEHRGTA